MEAAPAADAGRATRTATSPLGAARGALVAAADRAAPARRVEEPVAPSGPVEDSEPLLGELQDLLLEVRGSHPQSERLSLVPPGSPDRARRDLARALAGPVLGGQQPGRAPRGRLSGVSPGAGGGDGDPHRRERRLRPSPAPGPRSRRLPDRRRAVADAGDLAAPGGLADRRGAGRLSRPSAGVGRHHPALEPARRAHHPVGPRAPRARAGAGLPAGADRRRDGRRRQDPRAGRHVHEPHRAAERPPAPAPARGGARDRQVAPRELPLDR